MIPPSRSFLQVMQFPITVTGRHIRLTRVSKVLEIWAREWMLCPPCDGFPGYILPLACEDRRERHLSVNHHKWWLTDKCRLMTSFLRCKHCLCHLHQSLLAGQASRWDTELKHHSTSANTIATVDRHPHVKLMPWPEKWENWKFGIKIKNEKHFLWHFSKLICGRSGTQDAHAQRKMLVCSWMNHLSHSHVKYTG